MTEVPKPQLQVFADVKLFCAVSIVTFELEFLRGENLMDA